MYCQHIAPIICCFKEASQRPLRVDGSVVDDISPRPLYLKEGGHILPRLTETLHFDCTVNHGIPNPCVPDFDTTSHSGIFSFCLPRPDFQEKEMQGHAKCHLFMRNGKTPWFLDKTYGTGLLCNQRHSINDKHLAKCLDRLIHSCSLHHF